MFSIKRHAIRTIYRILQTRNLYVFNEVGNAKYLTHVKLLHVLVFPKKYTVFFKYL